MDDSQIKKNMKEYLEIAEYSLKKNKFNTAVTLYYKALVEICDLVLLNKLGEIGANHTERFEMLKTINYQLYKTASKLFRFYRDSYSKEISKTIAILVKEEVENAKRTIEEDKQMDKE